MIADEVNVKRVRFTEEIESYASFRLQVNARDAGPRLGADTKRALAAAKQGDWRNLPDGEVDAGGITLRPGEFTFLLEPKQGVACEALPGNDVIVVLDLDPSPELIEEGLARDVVRVVQQARKEADLHVSDRIHLYLELPDEFRRAVERFSDYVAEQTLATELRLDASGAREEASFHEGHIGGQTLRVGIQLASST